MRTSLTLCVVFLLLFWRLWNYLAPLHELGKVVGSVWIALTLSYSLSRFVWTRLFVTKIGGDGKAVLITELWSVVANAGIGSCGLLEWLTMETVTNIFDVNVFGALRVTKKFLPLLQKSSGRVVAIASPFGHFTQPMIVPYCMSKHAVVSMMDGLRRECHGSGVDFVIVEPSAYRTPIFKTGSTPMDLVMREFKQQEPEAIARYTHQDVEDWMKALGKSFNAIMREDPEEGVSVMERAVRETYPNAIYRSPWGLDTPCVFFMTVFPRGITDFASVLLHKIHLRMK
ncbi:D-beta-hydroxybutyrate dehydrogenase, mitochondrial-like isoform X2 [Dermacentor albipictus]|uniref:D-beta-hydroxybutyrate dehydrogenase, mitochondrial-like isoform X2 n=1 Tax=Dermacentor albipictus TaxID=60249 RepID=UPI0038FCBA73